MAITIAHTFVSAKGDGSDPTQVQPSHWNAAHTITLATAMLLGRASSGTGAAEEIPCTAAARTFLAAVDAAAERTVLGLGGAALLAVGTTAGTVAAGDDSRITGAAQKSANGSDFAVAATVRTNLGVAYASQAEAEAGSIGTAVMTPQRTAQAILAQIGARLPKAFGQVIGGVLQAGSYNIASVVDNGTNHTVSFTSAMPDTKYSVALALNSAFSGNTVSINYGTPLVGSFLVGCINHTSGAAQDPSSYSFVVFHNS